MKKAVEHFAEVQPLNAQSLADAGISLAENLIAQRRFGEAEARLLEVEEVLKNASAHSSGEMQRAKKVLAQVRASRKH